MYLKKNRSDMFSIFQYFFSEVKDQFNTFIKILRMDNAKDFFSSCFSNFVSQYSIVHQFSCSFTPQQNSIVERKNCHLLELHAHFNLGS